MSATPKKPKPSDGELAIRVQTVLTMRLNGAELHDLRAHALEQGWNVSDRTIRRYIDRADDLMIEGFEADREKLLKRHVTQRRNLYARALNDGDNRTALAVLKDEGELIGLYLKRELTPFEALMASVPPSKQARIAAILLEADSPPVHGGGIAPLGDERQGQQAADAGRVDAPVGPDAGPVAGPVPDQHG
jgi:hypothetical protein